MGGTVIAGMNAWAVSIIRYEAGVLDQAKEEQKSIDIKTKKLMPEEMLVDCILQEKKEEEGL